MGTRRVSAIVFLTASSVSWTGHTDDGRHELSFDAALKVAIAHNGDIYVARAGTEIASDDIDIAQSVYDPKLIVNARGSKDNELGSPARLNFDDRILGLSAEITGHVSSGGSYSLSVGTTYERFFSPFISLYDPTNTTALTLSVTQPLMRGRGKAVDKLPIVIAGLRRDLSQQQVRLQLEQVVGNLEIAYWELALAYKTRDARQSSVKLAQEQLAESARLVRLGSISDLDVVGSSRRRRTNAAGAAAVRGTDHRSRGQAPRRHHRRSELEAAGRAGCRPTTPRSFTRSNRPTSTSSSHTNIVPM